MGNWWKEGVVYQIYPKSFMDGNNDGVGDLLGIISKLDYLKYLGVDIIWLSPIYQSPGVDSGYDISDYQLIDNQFGTMEEFDMLLEKAHQIGIKIIMDLVVNHTSNQHKWFVESRKNINSPYRDYYIWKDPKDGKEPNNWASIFAGSAWEYDELSKMYYLHLYSNKQPDLNWENLGVRKEIYKMMDWWLTKGIDGFRLDVINKISKVQSYQDVEPIDGNFHKPSKYTSNGPRVHEFLQEMNKAVLKNYDIMTVGEITACSIEEARQYTNNDGTELSMLFQFEHMDVDAGEFGKWTPVPLDLVKLKKSFTKWQDGLANNGWNSLFLDNHDQPRIVSRFGDDKKYHKESAKMLATILHMLKGTPYIYQGEEIGMTNYPFTTLDECRDVEVFNNYQELVVKNKKLSHDLMMDGVRKSSRDNARTPMQWSNEIYGGFSKTEPWINVNPNFTYINVESQINDKDSILNYYQSLIKLRHSLDIVKYGKYEVYDLDNPNLYTYYRFLDDEKLFVLGNFKSETLDYKLPKEMIESSVLISNYKFRITENLRIPPFGCFVLYKK